MVATVFRTQWTAAPIVLCLLCSCASVSTRKDFYAPISADLRSQDYVGAIEKIDAAVEQSQYTDKERLLYYLDCGLAHHYAGNHRSSNEKLSLAEGAAEDLFTKSVSRAAASLLLNDNVLEYAGEDYEVLYTNLIMALNYLALDQFDEAFVEIRRANEKLALLEQKYADAGELLRRGAVSDTAGVGIDYRASEVRFNNDAFARYLSMHLYAADRLPDDAAIDLRKLRDAYRDQPRIYHWDPPPVRYDASGGSLLSVVALSGLAPVKEALNLRIRTDKDLNLVQVLYTEGKRRGEEYGHVFLPVDVDFYFKLSIPQIVTRPSAVRRVRVGSERGPIGELRLIEDVGSVALETFEARKSLIYLRAVGRAVFKGLLGERLKSKADAKQRKRKSSREGERSGGGLGGRLGTWLTKVAVDVATEVSESADLRCSRLLPGKILVGDFELDPGVYDLRIDFLAADGRVLYRREISGYQVRAGDLNLVEAVYLN